MDEVKVCESCLKFLDENNRLRKKIRQLQAEIRSLDLTPICKCNNKMSREYSKEYDTAFGVERNQTFVCLSCKKKDLQKRIELDSKIN